MGQAMVRISEESRETLRELACSEHSTIQAVLEKAIEDYRRKRFFEDLDAAYVKLQEDSEAWEAYQAELKVWDVTLADGLTEGEEWGDDGAPKRNAQSRG